MFRNNRFFILALAVGFAFLLTACASRLRPAVRKKFRPVPNPTSSTAVAWPAASLAFAPVAFKKTCSASMSAPCLEWNVCPYRALYRVSQPSAVE